MAQTFGQPVSLPAARPGGRALPSYEAGQYIALRRDDCLLTRKVKEGNEVRYVPDLDEQAHGARSLRRGDGTGRANNMLRKVLGLPLKEEGALAVPPRERPLAMMQKRIDPSRTVVLTCGNPLAMADIAWIAA